MDRSIVEVSKHDDIDDQLAGARLRTWEAVHRIAEQMKAGIDEDEARRMAQRTLAEMGARKFWHKCHVRIGEGTTQSFDDPYSNNVLQADDIFYIDIGPIWQGIEGDAGKTFVVGSRPDHERCERDVRAVFDAVVAHWRNVKASGVELARFASEEAQKLGWILVPNYVKGHRLSEFPHSFHTKASLYDLDFTPSPQRWVLEIQICDPAMKFGAFYEDVLT